MTLFQILVEFAPVPLALTAALLVATAFIQPRAALRSCSDRSDASTRTSLRGVRRQT